MLTIEHLTKQFGKKTLFRDLCLTVEGPAVLWAPSGWGKTTLLRILMGLEEPTSGIVQGVGRVAAVFQEDRLCPQLTAVQNVTLVLPGSAEQYKKQIIKDFQQFGMDAAALALPAARLSGGQKRRTALLRAFIAGGCVQMLGVVVLFTSGLAVDGLTDDLLASMYGRGLTSVCRNGRHAVVPGAPAHA